MFFSIFSNALVGASVPGTLTKIRKNSSKIANNASPDELTGCLLATLAASKPAGQMLELGTGTGVSASWLLSGMDAQSSLHSVELDNELAEFAQQELANDKRFSRIVSDAAQYFETIPSGYFDLIFAANCPDKPIHLNLAVRGLKPGGFYILDNLLPQANRLDAHNAKLPGLLTSLMGNPELIILPLDWSTGVVIAVKIPSVCNPTVNLTKAQ
ncbi:hypothetical protein AKJ29_13025 [Aliiroseovarius crassostreae]|uniref:Methyltransferase domain-containing protein n=1 Tax=Aliiroseovarius crassostreae TaxID=154981 RepID=A0A0P7IW39_9RHOB|nr:methyltransferase domain-containing protein [Aliiroseovarius crassostreae]KPN63553.1 hypothetical protein AKJ29_13025 [Aliiroseovarius crassostreae]